jgi:hypothetical protein
MEVIVAYYNTLSRHLLGRTQKEYEEKSVRIVDVPAEIRTGNLPNTSQKHYRLRELVRFLSLKYL